MRVKLVKPPPISEADALLSNHANAFLREAIADEEEQIEREERQQKNRAEHDGGVD